jgi:polyisoprenoid-binding protein YceI
MSTITAPARTAWTIDAAHSHVEFSVRHLMIATVKGRFGDVQGTIVLDDAAPAQSTIDVTIGAASIDTRMPQRDEHLRSADFFDVATFPTLTFKSRRVETVGDQFKVTGDLTIRGVTREVVLDVTPTGRQADPWGGQRAGFEATTKIKRSQFGLTWNQALETGGVMVGDDVKIAIDAELVQQSSSAAGA